MTVSLFFFFLLFLLLLLLSSTVSFSGDTTSLIYSTCSKSQYPPNSPYQLNLNSLLSSLSAASSFSLYSQFTTSSPSISGVFQCHGDLSISRCSSCLSSAISRLPSLCSSSTSGGGGAAGASVQLRGCYLRYGNDTFLGRADTELRYKTCSTSGNGGGEEFLAAREEAFAAVAATPATGTAYRVAAAGAVRVEAQCVGDLRMRDCDDCVQSAAAQVKVSCGGALAGEIYLGKCYVWYSGGGEIPYGGGGGRGGGEGSGGGNNDDEVEKTVAIMLGIIAVIVFIAICLYYLRRKAKGKQ